MILILNFLKKEVLKLMATMTTSSFYCTQCGNKTIPIMRNNGREREPGHLKILWCINCDKRVNSVEIKEYGSQYTLEDFYNEFNLGNFDAKGQRILPLKDFKSLKNLLYQKGIINEKGEIINEEKLQRGCKLLQTE